jgi:hypothetical protein
MSGWPPFRSISYGGLRGIPRGWVLELDLHGEALSWILWRQLAVFLRCDDINESPLLLQPASGTHIERDGIAEVNSHSRRVMCRGDVPAADITAPC